jgi:transcriptional regulator with XRE-family HTH domain
MPRQRNVELGAFLRSRRAALSPDDTDVVSHGAWRRVPGLRREEVAQLAGVSPSYYTRIEQGEIDYFSDAVLDSLVQALRLDDTERLHLLRLARPRAARQRVPTQDEPVRDSVRQLVEGNTTQAVILIGRHADLLAGNRLGYALLGLPYGERVNMARLIFLDPATRDLVVQWEQEARAAAARLRIASSYDPGNQDLAELIGDLCINSDDFARIWATHPVMDCPSSVLEYRHPAVGHLSLYSEGLTLPGDPGKLLVVNTAPENSESAERLSLLGTLHA